MPKRPAQYNKIYKRLSFAKSCGLGLYSQVFAMVGAVPNQFPVPAGELLISLNPVSCQSVFKTSRISQADCNKSPGASERDLFELSLSFGGQTLTVHKQGRMFLQAYVLNRFLS